jgi:hypothetical protein
MYPVRKVLIIKDNIFADLISEGVYASRVKYTYGGVLFDIFIENDEFIVLDDETDNEWEEDEQ